MSNIATKLTYLNGTKQAIKQAINEDFEVIDDNTTFREYADEISSNNAKYKDLIPKETTNATNTLDISNSSGLDKTLVTQYGNTYQETNANVFNDTLAQTTYTGTGAVVENSPTRFNFINGYTYTINIKFTSNNVSTINQNRILGIRTYKDIGYTGRGVIINSDNLSSGTGSITFTVEENYNRFNFINYADFQSGTITITDFEIITNTPAPDYPQEIVNISGKSTLKDVGENLFDGVLEIGNFNSNTGEKIANNDYIINTNPIPVEELTNYKISSNGTGIRMYVFEYKEDMTYNLSTRKKVNDNEYLTTNSGTKYINFRTIDANTNLQEKIQVEKGSTASDYEPYKEQSFDLDLKSKNLFDKSNITTGKTYTATGGISTLNNSFVQETYIPVSSSTAYTMSTTNDYSSETDYRLVICEYKDDKTFIKRNLGRSAVGNKYTITTTENTKYVRLCASTITKDELQFEKGQATSYAPYFTPIELCKIGNYKDRIYPLNGKWYLEKNIEKVVLNGSEAWGTAGEGDTTNGVSMYWGISDAITVATKDLISDYFRFIPRSSVSSTTINFITGGGGNSIVLNIAKTSLETQTLAGFKTWLSTHNAIVYYPLATPTTEEITESNYPTLYNQLNNIKLFEGVNHITMTNESGLDVEFDITYYKDWKLD